MAINIDFSKLNGLLSRLQEEVLVVVNTLREKSAERFARPLLVCGVMILASYRLVYLPTANKLKELDAGLATAKATAQYADAYKDLRDRLESLYSQLPPLKDKDQWLLNSLVESLRADNIVSDSFQAPKEQETASKSLIAQSVDVRSKLKYAQILSWLTRVEGLKPLLSVTALEITKNSQQIGENDFSCSLGTAIPKTRPGS